MIEPFLFACPLCRSPLVRTGPQEFFCPVDGAIYPRHDGIWHFLPPQYSQSLGQFMWEYLTVRTLEGRGSPDPGYYRGLPFEDRTGQFSADWKIRANSFRALIRTVVVPLEKETGRPLKVLDLGAGNGWLSYRLARRGHTCAAVDLQTNALDGLGAHIHYDAAFTPIQADFNHLPFQDSQADLVIFNASFHYATSYATSLAEALRVLCPPGQVVILDSPLYRKDASGAAMVREREAQFRQRFGFPSNAIPSQNYLTVPRLAELGTVAGVDWRLVGVFYGVGWALRPLRAWIAGRRAPAQFRLIVGSRRAGG